MPKLYLSPSTQEFNYYVNGGTEEYHMNRIADAMEPYLHASGIQYTRNTPDMTAASSIAASNSGNYDFHLAIHSNAAPPSLSGQLRGSIVYYYPTSYYGKKAAEIFVQNLKQIYPLPDLVRASPTTSIGEVRYTRAPANLIELAYHDNPEDAAWITENTDTIARTLVKALTEYFGIPFITPAPEYTGTVHISSGYLNIRSRPSTSAPVIAKAYNGAQLTILGKWNNWYVVEFGGVPGYANASYVVV